MTREMFGELLNKLRWATYDAALLCARGSDGAPRRAEVQKYLAEVMAEFERLKVIEDSVVGAQSPKNM